MSSVSRDAITYKIIVGLPARFTIGRNSKGRWVVLDRDGRIGGLFTTESAALHFASEGCNGNHLEIRRAPDGEIVEPAPISFELRVNVH
ncbi:hypothetical protein [Rhizobium sp. R693]|uniref:hypothetical protein n=1 Tax=Rhizobium sp. R693 TaxID=1764276 RepID=UPI000B52EA9E|nr:hypothetical protein [Rhizobium sp. R693]OWV97218.1 hypothetical protein ATY79_22935 [Rhizobium sp. R693]